MFKVGDLVTYKYGSNVYEVIEVYESPPSPSSTGFFSKPAFKARSINTKFELIKIFRVNSMNDLKLTTEKDLIKSLEYNMLKFKVNDKIGVRFSPEDLFVYIYDDEESWIQLDRKSVKKLRDILGEIK